MKKYSSFALILVIVILASCGSTNKMSKSLTSLSKNDWQLYSLNAQQYKAGEVGKIPKLSFDATKMQVSGNTGCNSLSGLFTSEKDKLSFGQLATTRMACPSDNIEPQFLDALSKTSKFSIYEGKLVLNDADGKQLMVMEPSIR